MSRYDGTDRYTYPGTDVLINKPGLVDSLAFEAFEADATAVRMLELLQEPPTGSFNVAHLREIHRHLFQDVYEWAGEFRLVDITRGTSRFANFARIEGYFIDLESVNQEQMYAAMATSFNGDASLLVALLNEITAIVEP